MWLHVVGELVYSKSFKAMKGDAEKLVFQGDGGIFRGERVIRVTGFLSVSLMLESKLSTGRFLKTQKCLFCYKQQGL